MKNIQLLIILSIIEHPNYLKHLDLTQLQELVAQRCSVKKGFLEILQNIQENICAKNFAKFLRTPFLTEHPRWLLLNCTYIQYCNTSRFWKHLL